MFTFIKALFSTFVRHFNCVTLYIYTDMLSKVFGFMFLVLNVIAKESTILKDVYAIQTNELPKSSCHEISNIQIESRCLGTCVNTMDDIVMISHDDSTETCMCCNNFTGSDILGQNWKSYVRRICKHFFFK